MRHMKFVNNGKMILSGIIYLLIFSLPVLIPRNALFADTIILPGGRTIECRITKEDKNSLTAIEFRTNRSYSLSYREINEIKRDSSRTDYYAAWSANKTSLHNIVIFIKKDREVDGNTVKEIKDKKEDKDNKKDETLVIKGELKEDRKGSDTIRVFDYYTCITLKISRSHIEKMMTRQEEEAMEEVNAKEEKLSSAPGAFRKKYKPRIGLLPTPIMPVGVLGSVLGMGYGANVFCDLLLPFQIGKSFHIRGGMLSGYSSFSSKDPDVTASVSLIPILLFGEFFMNTKSGLRPFIKLSSGITMTSVSVSKKPKNESKSYSSMDGTFAIGLGTGYNPKALRNIEFILGADYMMAFEEVTGNFLVLSIGAAYKF